MASSHIYLKIFLHPIDLNECASEANDCRYDCKNLIGTFMCVCPEGFRKLGASDECQDIDECATGGNGELYVKDHGPR